MEIWAQPFSKLAPENPILQMKTSEGDIYLELFPKAAPKTVSNFMGLALGTQEYRDPITLEKSKKPFYNGLSFYRVHKEFAIQTGDPIGTGTGGPFEYSFEDEINATALGLHTKRVFDSEDELHPYLREGKKEVQEVIQKVILPQLKKEFQVTSGMSEAEQKKIFNEKIAPRVFNLTFKELFEASGYHYNEQLPSYPPFRGTLAMDTQGPNGNGSRFLINVANNEWMAGRNTIFGRVIQGMDIVDKIASVEVDNNYR
ncbi:MAG: peptidylprolyl isomerase, partial [Planctomycetota bacterium]